MSRVSDSSGYVPRDSQIPNVKSGDALTPRYVQKITQGIERSSVVNGVGYGVQRLSNATILSIPKSNNGATVSVSNFKVTIVTVDKTVSTDARAYVSVGTVNRCIPKIGTVYLDRLRPSDNKQPYVEFGNDGYIGIKVTYTAGVPFPSTSVIEWRSSLPTTSTDSESFYPLASVTWNLNAQTEAVEATVTQIHLSRNLSVNRFKIGTSTYYWQWYLV